MLRRLGLGLSLAACVGGTAWGQGATIFDGTYMGQLTLTRIVKGDCTPPAPGALFPLTIAQGRVRFSYQPRFDTELTGRVRPNGAFVAAARIHGGLVHMAGRVENGNVTARIKSPSCRYIFHTQE